MSQSGLRRQAKACLVAFLLVNFMLVGQGAFAANQEDLLIDVVQQEEAKQKPDENLVKNILFITIDGLSEESVVKGNTPNLNGLAGSGVRTKAIGIFPASTPMAVATILTGAVPVEHKFTQSGAVTKVTSLPEIIAENKQTAVIIDGDDGITKGLSPKVKFLSDNNSDISATDLALKEFEKNKPYFMHVILSGVDRANKKYGPNSKEHFAAVEEADKQVGRLLGKLHEYGLFQYSLVVASGTYGVSNPAKGKKFTTNNEVLVPLFIKGPTIESGITIPVASLINIAPTISYILGLKTANQNNRVLWDILKNEGGASEAYLLKKRVNDLGESLIESTRKEYSLENDKMIVNDEKNYLSNERGKVQQIIDAKNKEIRKRDLQLNIYKILGVLILIIFVLGLFFEYTYLKKKFLMFK